jgi:hypothetical protein
VVSVAPWLHFSPGKRPPVPIVQEAGRASEPVWTQKIEEKSFCLCRGSNLDRPVIWPIARHYTDWATQLTWLHFTPKKRPLSTRWIEGWVGPRAGMEAEAGRKILCSSQGLNSSHPACIQALYWMRYAPREDVYRLIKYGTNFFTADGFHDCSLVSMWVKTWHVLSHNCIDWPQINQDIQLDHGNCSINQSTEYSWSQYVSIGD